MTEIDKSEALITIIHESNEYIKLQEQLSSFVAQGTLQLALARRDNKSVSRFEDIRTEFDKTLSVRENLDLEVVCCNDGDDIEMFCGLPPPALRRAKDKFRSAATVALQLCTHIRTIEKQRELIQDNLLN